MTDSKNSVNGVALDTLVATVGAIDATPGLGQFNFRAHTAYKVGEDQLRSTFIGAKQNGEERLRDTPLTWDSPVTLTTSGAALQTATETVLHAMSHCFTVTSSYQGAARGVPLDKMVMDATATVDLNGALGLNPRKRAGLNNVHIQASIDSTAPEAQVWDLFRFAQTHSVMLQTIRQEVDVQFAFDVQDATGPASGGAKKSALSEDLGKTLKAIETDANEAMAKYHSRLEWKGTAKVETKLDSEEKALIGDEPEILLGHDTGPGPTEWMLQALGYSTCIMIAREVDDVTDIEVDLDGFADLSGFLALDDFVKAGFQTVKANVTVKTTGDKAAVLKKLQDMDLPKKNIVSESIQNPVNTTFGLTLNGKPAMGVPMMAATTTGQERVKP